MSPEAGEQVGVAEVGAYGVCADVIEVVFDALEVLEADFGGLNSAAPDGGYYIVAEVDFGWGFGGVFGSESGEEFAVGGGVFGREDYLLCVNAWF